MRFLLRATEENIQAINNRKKSKPQYHTSVRKYTFSEEDYLEVETTDPAFREEVEQGEDGNRCTFFLENVVLDSYSFSEVKAFNAKLREPEKYTYVSHVTILNAAKNEKNNPVVEARKYFTDYNTRAAKNIFQIDDIESGIIVTNTTFNPDQPTEGEVAISYHQHYHANIARFSVYDRSGDESNKVMTFDENTSQLHLFDLKPATKKKKENQELTLDGLRVLLEGYKAGKREGSKTALVDRIIAAINEPATNKLNLSDQDLKLLRNGKLRKALKAALNGGSIGQYFTRTFPSIVSQRVDDALASYIATRENTSNDSKVALAKKVKDALKDKTALQLTEQEIAQLNNGSLNRLLKHALRDSADAKVKHPVMSYLRANNIAKEELVIDIKPEFISALRQYQGKREHSFLFQASEVKRQQKVALVGKILGFIAPVSVSAAAGKSEAQPERTLVLTEDEIALLGDGQLKRLLEKSLKIKGSAYATSTDPIVEYLKSQGITVKAAVVEQEKEGAAFIHNKVDAVAAVLYGPTSEELAMEPRRASAGLLSSIPSQDVVAKVRLSVDRRNVQPGVGEALYEPLLKLRTGRSIKVQELEALRTCQAFRDTLALKKPSIVVADQADRDTILNSLYDEESKETDLKFGSIQNDSAFKQLLIDCGYDISTLPSGGSIGPANPKNVDRAFERSTFVLR